MRRDVFHGVANLTAERCKKALKLTNELHKKAAEAAESMVKRDRYTPYLETVEALDEHYARCKTCARWWLELTEEHG